jgi:lysylphosphatidylglycerol synthetase-like protein (DUF2156 family)
MALTDVAGHAVERFASRLGRRAAAWLFVAIFALTAIYQATAAASLALEFAVGAVNAHLIIAAFFVVAALIVVTILWATSHRRAQAEAARTRSEIQIASIVEALLLGYSLSRGK